MSAYLTNGLQIIGISANIFHGRFDTIHNRESCFVLKLCCFAGWFGTDCYRFTRKFPQTGQQT